MLPLIHESSTTLLRLLLVTLGPVPVLHLTHGLLPVTAREIQPVSPVLSTGPVSYTIITIAKEVGLAVPPVGEGDRTITIGANKRLLRAAAAEAQPDRRRPSYICCTRALLLCAGCDQVGSERGALRLRLSVSQVEFPVHHAQTAAGTETEALRAAARGRIGAWERRVIQMVR